MNFGDFFNPIEIQHYLKYLNYFQMLRLYLVELN